MTDFKDELDRSEYLPETVETRLGFPLDRNCAICGLPTLLTQVNEMLVKGRTYQSILDHINADDEVQDNVTRYTLKNHQEKHLPYAQKALRTLVEENAKRYSKNIEEGENSILTAAAYAEAVMHRGFSKLSDPIAEITINDGLRAAMTLEELREKQQEVTSSEKHLVQLNRIIDAVREFSTPETWEKIARKIQGEDYNANDVRAAELTVEPYDAEEGLNYDDLERDVDGSFD